MLSLLIVDTLMTLFQLRFASGLDAGDAGVLEGVAGVYGAVL